MANPELVMPFGKHKNKTIEEIPSGYLRWMVEELDGDKDEELIEAAEAELDYRDKFHCHIADDGD